MKPKHKLILIILSVLSISLIAVFYGNSNHSTSKSQAINLASSTQNLDSTQIADSIIVDKSENNDGTHINHINDAQNTLMHSGEIADSYLPADYTSIRPDVLHILQNTFQDPEKLATAIAGSAILQNYLNDAIRGNQVGSIDAVQTMYDYDCKVLSLTQDEQNFVKSITLDTPERQKLWQLGLANYQPPVSVDIQIDADGNAISPCATNPL